jgi:hypothetical protein
LLSSGVHTSGVPLMKKPVPHSSTKRMPAFSPARGVQGVAGSSARAKPAAAATASPQAKATADLMS